MRIIGAVAASAFSLLVACSDDASMRKPSEVRPTSTHLLPANPSLEMRLSQAARWISEQQNPDGSWGAQWKSAMTAFAMQFLLGRAAEFDENCTGGAKYLIRLAGANQGFFSEWNSNHGVYEHAIALTALLQFAKKRGSPPGLQQAIDRAVTLIIENQQDEGGWAYGSTSPHYVGSGRDDVSVTSWHCHALVAAEDFGMRTLGLNQALRRGVDYLWGYRFSTKDNQGLVVEGFGQHLQRNIPYSIYSMNGPVLSVILLSKFGEPNANAKIVINRCIKLLMENINEEPLDWNKNGNLYTWYGTTLALRRADRQSWNTWASQLLPQLTKYQRQDGSWAPEESACLIATSKAASRDADLYRAALCALMLEMLRAGSAAN